MVGAMTKPPNRSHGRVGRVPAAVVGDSQPSLFELPPRVVERAAERAEDLALREQLLNAAIVSPALPAAVKYRARLAPGRCTAPRQC
jgi:hypothetical protein